MRALSIYFPTVRRLRRRAPEPGARPGTLEIPPELPPPTLRLIRFGKDRFDELDTGLEEAGAAVAGEPGVVTWLDVQGLGSSRALGVLGEALGLHPLSLEDIAHAHQRPKVEAHDDYLFVVLRCVRRLDEQHVDNEQISMVLKKNLLVTFQERPGDGFDVVRQRLRDPKGAMRKHGADYLLYALIDLIIDLAFPVIEIYGDAMDRLDDEVLEAPSKQTSLAIHGLKRELRALRRALWPLRDLAATLSRDPHALISAPVRGVLRDCHDHALLLADFIEGAKERVGDLGDRYVAAMSERTNQVMKVLTMVATIFIPLTYLAGLYGMNFDPDASPYNMPELRWRFGYIAFWILSASVALGMVFFFARKGWLGGDGRGQGPDGAADEGEGRGP